MNRTGNTMSWPTQSALEERESRRTLAASATGEKVVSRRGRKRGGRGADCLPQTAALAAVIAREVFARW
jgi:hypothetical protein